MTGKVLLVALALAPLAAGAANPTGAAGPLTLEQAVAAALAHQPQLRAARAQVQAAQARMGQATAGLLPQVTGSASLARSGGAATSPASAGNTWSYGLSGSQLLFDFGQAWYARAAAGAAAEAQGESERDATQAVLLGVRGAWFSAAAARDLLAVAKETLDNQALHLEQTKGFVAVGTRPEIDLAQAKAARANALVQYINSQNGLATGLAQLNQAMGVTGSTDYELAPSDPPPVPGEDGSLEALMAEALSSRPDLAAQARQRQAQEATLKSLYGGYAPTLSAFGKVNETGPRLDETLQGWSAGLTLTWPLFTGFRTTHQASEARANLDALDASGELLRQQIRVALEQALLSVRAAKAVLTASGEVVVNAREQLRLAQARYQAGLGSSVELNDAQVALTSALAQEVGARFNLAASRAALQRALGRNG